MQRREFLTAAALTTAAAMLPQPSFSQSSNPLKKAVLISMLPKDMPLLDRFKLAIDCGFEAMEAQTVTDPKEAEAIKEAQIRQVAHSFSDEHGTGRIHCRAMIRIKLQRV
ncbi:MAG: hypothetical protein U0Y68_14785 [Blastocatellia bacterium]